MLSFSPKQKPKDYFSRREQYRLMALVGAIGLLVIIVGSGARSAHWSWLLSGAKTAEVEQPIDNRIRSTAAAEDDEVPITQAQLEMDPPEDSSGRYFPGVKPSYLESVRDDTVRLRAERDAWSHLMNILRESDQQSLVAASTGAVGFVQLFQQPDAYRGELVTVKGTVHWAHPSHAASGTGQINPYYELWIQTEGASFPIVIDCLELPAGFPIGKDLREPIEATGFYFKRLGYGAQDGMRTTPLLLAKTIDWHPQATGSPAPGEQSFLSWIVLGTIAGTLLLGVLLALQTNRHKIVKTPADIPSQQFRALQSEEVLPDVATSLGQLSRESD